MFYISVSNTDDHLRNHGFLLTPHGWTLSTAYDINPLETGAGLSPNINEYENALDVDLARTVAPYFRVSEKMREVIIRKIENTIGRWPSLAEKSGIP